MDRRGFSLIEILVGLAIVVVVATVVTPNLVGLLDRARIDRAAASLENMGEAIGTFEEDVNRAPSALTHLVEPISPDQESSCGKSYPPGLANRWAGPYLNRLVPATGVPVAIGSVLPEIEQVGNGSGSALRLTIVAVAHEDAIELERRTDGDEDPTGGAIRYTAPDAEGLVTLYYHLPVRGC